MFKVVSSVDNGLWGEFVRGNERGNVFQGAEMAEVYANTKRMEPVTLFAVRGGEIYACLVAYISTEGKLKY